MIRAERLARGEQTFDQFARETMADWDRIAAYLMRRWRVPQAVEQTDVLNELLMQAWLHVRKFDPARGLSPERYVIYSAISRTKRWMHRQRRARGCRDESRHELTFAELGIAEDLRTCEPGQEAVVERELELDRLIVECDSLRERILVTAVWHLGDAREAANAVYSDPELRQACRFDSRREAARAAELVGVKVSDWRAA